jgi:hemerythrin
MARLQVGDANHMPFTIAWSNDYSVGDPRIDTEHQELINVANLVLGLTAMDKDTLATLFRGLTKYCRHHFSNEEQLMALIGYPLLTEHRLRHRAIVQQMEKVLRDSTSIADLQDSLRRLMYTWLVHHIDENDRKIACFVRTGSPDEAPPIRP